MQKQQFGIMDQGYIVPKSQILSWINHLLKVHISKIQTLGSGSIYCQLFDVIHPNKLNLHKINWKAKNDNQFLANFKLLQSAFQKTGVKRHIEVQKLVKAKYQDNWQFIQWFKRYFDLNCGTKGQGYDAIEKRNKIVPDFGFAQKTIASKTCSGSGQIQPKSKEFKQDSTTKLHSKKQQPSKHQTQTPVKEKSQKKQKMSTSEKEQKPQKILKSQKPQITQKPIQKVEKKLVKAPTKPSSASYTNRVKTEVHQKKQEPKKILLKKQQTLKKFQAPTAAKKQDAMKKKPVTVHQIQSTKKIESTAIKNNLSSVHHSGAVKNKQPLKNDQKIKQLEGKIDKIKLIVSSDKEFESIVNEIKDLLNIKIQKQNIKQQQPKQQPSNQQGEKDLLILVQKIQQTKHQEIKGQIKENAEPVTQFLDDKLQKTIQDTHQQNLLTQQLQSHCEQSNAQQKKEEVVGNQNVKLQIQTKQNEENREVKKQEVEKTEVINEKPIQETNEENINNQQNGVNDNQQEEVKNGKQVDQNVLKQKDAEVVEQNLIGGENNAQEQENIVF